MTLHDLKRRSKGNKRRISSRANTLSSSLSWMPSENERRLSKTVIVEDFVSTWRLDVESGYIEQEATGKDDEIDDGGADKRKQARCCRCSDRLKTIDQNGGDFSRRSTAALRPALGSVIFFSALIFSHPPYLGAAWIGNIFMHTTMKDSVGSSFIAVKSFAKSIIVTTLVFTMPIQYILSLIPLRTAEIIFPPITFLVSFLIMSCPWLTSPNLMVLVMYVAVAAPIRFETLWWEPLGYLGSYLIGLVVALLMNLLPPFRPNTATRKVHLLMERMDKDIFLFFMQVRYYTFNTGQSPKVARTAGATIDLLVKRINPTIQTLKVMLPSVRAEAITAKDRAKVERLDRWVSHLDKMSVHFKMLRNALNARYLGENNGNDPDSIYVHHIRRTIASELGQDYHNLVNSFIAATIALNKHANPYLANEHSFDAYLAELSERLELTQQGFARALYKVSDQLEHMETEGSVSTSNDVSSTPPSSQTDCTAKPAKIPVYAHLARRMTSMYSVVSIGQGLIDFITESDVCDKIDPSEDYDHEARDFESSVSKGFTEIKSFPRWCSQRTQACTKYLIATWWAPKWKWRNIETRRLALKTALGMLVSSLWIAVPYLWDIAQPFGFWPGLTIASVNLATAGSSFHKALDRLVGTLFAAAYALIVADFFPGNKDYIKIPAIGVFTFLVIYMKKSDHAYQYTYAATSIGSMLYGSVKNDFNVQAYVPKRIQLIFIGVVTFTVIELLVFPRSSRKIMEQKCLEFFDEASSFLEKSTECLDRLQSGQLQKHPGAEEEGVGAKHTQPNDTRNLDTIDPMVSLCKASAALKTTSATLKKEVTAALQEPRFGFHQPLNPQGLNALVSEIVETEKQACFLVDALKSVASFLLKENRKHDSTTQALHESDLLPDHEHLLLEGNPLPRIDVEKQTRNLNWLHAYSAFSQIARTQMIICTTNLRIAYPDGRLRPQNKNTLKAILAAASFRDFHDVRFEIVSEWSQYCKTIGFHEYGGNGADLLRPDRLPILGITTSFLLEMCRHLQQAGLKMEWNIQTFPPT